MPHARYKIYDNLNLKLIILIIKDISDAEPISENDQWNRTNVITKKPENLYS